MEHSFPENPLAYSHRALLRCCTIRNESSKLNQKFIHDRDFMVRNRWIVRLNVKFTQSYQSATLNPGRILPNDVGCPDFCHG